jgi:hypothetical protein
MPLSWSVVRSSTSTLEFTMGPMPTTHTVLSVSALASEASSFSSAKTSERPICALPSRTSERPWPEPPPVMAMVTSGFSSSNFLAAASTSGWNEVAPEQFTVPERALALESELAEESELVSELLEPPQPTRPRPARATAVPPASERKERRERLSDMLLLPEGVTAPSHSPGGPCTTCMLWVGLALPRLVGNALRHPDRTLHLPYIWCEHL